MRGTQQNSKHSTGSKCAIPTGGEVFEDGTLIELVENSTQTDGLSLLFWDGRKAVVTPRRVRDGQTYVPLALDPRVRRALRLASSTSPAISTATLFEQLVAVIEKHTNLPEHSCCQLVAFIFASWLADCLPAPINLSLWSPVATDGARVLRLLHCFCRQALALSGTSARDLALLPTELQATLLIFRPASGRRVRELLAACGWQGFLAARSGRFGEFAGSVALSTDSPLNDRTLDPLIEIPIIPSRQPLPILDKRVQRELAREFQPRLLRYRLLHYKMAASRPESAEGASAGQARQLATGLWALFADEPKLRDQQVALVIEAEHSLDETRRADLRVPLIEVMWARCHEAGREQLHVGEIALDLNKVLSLTGDGKLTERMVGSLLKSVGLRTGKLDRKGRGIKLNPPTRKLIHQLARVHEVPSAETPFAGCPECAQVQSNGKQGLENKRT